MGFCPRLYSERALARKPIGRLHKQRLRRAAIEFDAFGLSDTCAASCVAVASEAKARHAVFDNAQRSIAAINRKTWRHTICAMAYGSTEVTARILKLLRVARSASACCGRRVSRSKQPTILDIARSNYTRRSFECSETTQCFDYSASTLTNAINLERRRGHKEHYRNF